MAKERKARENLDKEEFDLLKPIDVLTLGSKEDPCFGKYPDLKAPECMECGDSEFCTIIKAQNMHKERLKIEGNQRFKDIEEADYEMTQIKRQVKNMVSQYQSKGYPRLKTVLVVAKKLNVSKDIVKEVYDKNS